ncbi:MAG: 3-hydroxyacyl-CoA dehydrogenase family protein [Promethearchaeota archaeon]|nr:MAG: 3-hydroxyacyl-CoA dehydrogenase family protein [Candidatus Lokiarchaeota archaeon]
MEIKKVVVVGAGTMGHSIAQVYAQSGYEVTLVDLNQEILTQAITKIKSNLETLVEYGILNQNGIANIIERIHTSEDLTSCAKDANLIVEAIPEIPELKEKLFLQLSELCPEDCIFASNTSSLDIFKIAKNINNPKRLVIHHWFAPPHIIPLVEIVPSRKTSKDIIDLSIKLIESLGKKPILLNKFTESFIVNKIQNAISSVVFQLILMKIASPETIDQAIKHSLGIRLPIVGVAQTLDFTGLELVYDIAKNKGVELGFIKEKVDQGHCGAKSSKGLYDYQGRSEKEILRKRDLKYLQIYDFLKKINAFEPI